jgi:hypothetical protein
VLALWSQVLTIGITIRCLRLYKIVITTGELITCLVIALFCGLASDGEAAIGES